MKRLRNLWNLVPTELEPRLRGALVILATAGWAGLAILLDRRPDLRLPFGVCVALVGGWAVTTLLWADVRVAGDRVEYRAWRGMRSVALHDAQRGELTQSGFDRMLFARLERTGRHVRWPFVPAKNGANCLARKAR